MGLRDIKQRIKSTKSTQQITKAMNLVASSKLQKIKGRVVAARPFLLEIRRVLSNIILQTEEIHNAYIDKRPVENSLVIVIAGDRGLCGAYNSNVLKEAVKVINSRKSVKVIALGGKTLKFFSDKNYDIIKFVTGISDKPFYEDATEISNIALEMFAMGDIDEVVVVYTKFLSMLSYEVTVETMLPVDTASFTFEDDDKKEFNDVMEFEPKAEMVLNHLLPKYVNVLLFDAMLEAAACELASRTASMDSATKNADERIEDMTLSYNRARQSVITKEIIEVVAGANALN
ncbi:MAG: ATP synthase F1 subunit gamma [Defluviitaleaceae bacterium]|nr:ATP synthase F1 subunit gamma [Defluviitaleaceae bacterium]